MRNREIFSRAVRDLCEVAPPLLKRAPVDEKWKGGDLYGRNG